MVRTAEALMRELTKVNAVLQNLIDRLQKVTVCLAVWTLVFFDDLRVPPQQPLLLLVGLSLAHHREVNLLVDRGESLLRRR